MEQSRGVSRKGDIEFEQPGVMVGSELLRRSKDLKLGDT